MTDRLGEVQGRQRAYSTATEAAGDEIAFVEDGIQELEGLVHRLQQHQSDSLAKTDARAQHKIDAIQSKIHKKASACKETLQQLNHKAVKMKNRDDPAGRILDRQVQTLTRKLMQTTQDCWNVQDSHKKQMKSQVSRRLRSRMTKKDGSMISQEEADELTEDVMQNGLENEIFSNSVAKLEAVLQTRQEILHLETAMRELNQMFCDMHQLVVEQGEGLDYIHKNVQVTEKNIEQGVKDIRQARVYQKKCCVCCCK